MDRLPSPADSIERFAQLCRRLGDAFAPRSSILGEAGLDEVSFREIEHAWMRRLDGALAERFAAVFAAGEESTAPVAGETQTWREEARTVPLLRAGEAPRSAVPWPSERAAKQTAPRLLDTSSVDVDRTLELPIGHAAPPLPFRPAMPFTKAPSETPPRRRLHRFDPQTGLPLPAPVWVDLASAPSLKP